MRNNELDQMKFVLADARLFVLAWCTLSGITIDEWGVINDGFGRDFKGIGNSMFIDYNAMYRNHLDNCRDFGEGKFRKIHKMDLLNALREICDKERDLGEMYEGIDPVVIFLEEKEVVRRDMNEVGSDFINTKDLNAQYAEWAEENGFRPKTKRELGRRMSKLGFQHIRKRFWKRNNTTFNSWVVNTDCKLRSLYSTDYENKCFFRGP